MPPFFCAAVSGVPPVTARSGFLPERQACWLGSMELACWWQWDTRAGALICKELSVTQI